MDPVQIVTGFFSGGLLYLIPFVAVLSIVVFVHEYGHFKMGRLFNTRVETFSIGFGKALVHWHDRHGTRWQIGWLPLGGYVKFWGDEDATSWSPGEKIERLKNDPQAAACFHFKPLYQRALIVAAGPAMNFVFAIIVYAALFSTAGVTRFPALAGEIIKGGAAEQAGVQSGDRIVGIDGKAVKYFDEMQRIVMSSDGAKLRLEIDRAGQLIELDAQPTRVERTDRWGNKFTVYALQLALNQEAKPEFVRLGIAEALAKGAGDTWFIVDRTFAFIGGLFMGKEDPSQLQGPIGIAKTSGDVFGTLGFLALIQLMAILSVSVGLINLFPIPMLDGGHLLFYGAEAVRGRPLGERAQEIGFRIGLALVFSLMLFATWNDIARILNASPAG